MVVSGNRYADGSDFTYWVNAATGAMSPITDGYSGGNGELSPTIQCVYDEVSTVVCSGDDSTDPDVFALDALSGKALWQLPDTATNRMAPAVATAWHGAVYGTTTNGPVILDARTGADRTDTPGAAPALVDGYVGLTYAKAGDLEAYQAIG